MWLSFLKKQKPSLPSPNYSFLNADMHAHFLPGLDDGAPDMQTSLQLIDGLRQLGYRKLIASPHISMEFYPNTPELINSALQATREAVAEKGWDIEIATAAEYMIDDYFMQLLEANEPLLSFGDKYVLIEMGYVHEHPMFKQAIFQLQALGYVPVLAHPERYHFYFNKLQEIEAITKMGCLLQLNIMAIAGHYGERVRKQAGQLLQSSLYSFAGTDLHRMSHADVLSSFSSNQLKSLIDYNFKNHDL